MLVSAIVTAILCFRLTFITAALGFSGFKKEELHENCVLALQMCMFFNDAGFHIAFWRKRKELVWLFNQTCRMNKGKQCSPGILKCWFETTNNVSKLTRFSRCFAGTKLHTWSTLPEKIMLAWIPLTSSFLLTLTLDLVFYPKGRQHMLSYLPSRESRWVIAAYFGYDTGLWFVFMMVALLEYALQVYLIKSLIRLSRILP